MTKKKIFGKRCVSMLLTLTMMFTITGCKSNGKSKDKETQTTKYEAGNLLDGVEGEKVQASEIDNAYIDGVTDFSISLFKTNAMESIKKGENVMISPESVLLALGMTASGADGNTLNEMEQVLCAGMDIKDLNEYNYSFANQQLEGDDSFKIANSIWFKDDGNLSVKEDFLKTDKTYYNADAFKEPFDATTLGAINGWVYAKTNGMINKILDKISEDALMYLINAVTFEGKWAEEYEDYQVQENKKFTNADGKVSKVNMLISTEDTFMQDDKAKAFIKPYEGNKYGFMAILPNEGVDMEEYINGLTGDAFHKLYQSKDNNVIVQTEIPEFTTDYQTTMNDALKDMGMSDAFNDEKADFSRMAEDSEGNIYIGQVIHKTHIEVDRSGTKAAAVTVVEVDCETAAMEEPQKRVEQIKLNRPFVYAIVDIETGLPVFMGVYQNAK